ncbi:hypothetical protein [Chitinivibrio alkaliphilus]|uniref:Uncharacterized protein n=1 Tax=Chitinivibrio alkaliphilus ACht1 TaxID=1313304 RepID=U7D2J3_9BACT|nr:hypothetical protein [Chitinivibrio alkaliphilus]ERP30724.1 hypothetical protein CALK_2439 [Chitinivibrio alkaliphilus ACht1]
MLFTKGKTTILWKILLPMGSLLLLLALCTISGVSILVSNIINSAVDQQESMVFEYLDSEAVERQKTLNHIFTSGQRKSYEIAAAFAEHETVEQAMPMPRAVIWTIPNAPTGFKPGPCSRSISIPL